MKVDAMKADAMEGGMAPTGTPVLNTVAEPTGGDAGGPVSIPIAQPAVAGAALEAPPQSSCALQCLHITVMVFGILFLVSGAAAAVPITSPSVRSSLSLARVIRTGGAGCQACLNLAHFVAALLMTVATSMW
eukprot:CAMPEP_0181320088 /NCGR_PEP_ID=MMETSP1101-20121128/17928_1 /TAXON_ID=46948 /ORGANISM="Rhodomonas abbreviata, Strain Caron Lab Isolate" /LENGTH=131 /DNA_ID=CAMNT_0023427751 /DNA_START=61 /DNA_END=453 /DNA_ORIENTATION=-